MKCRQTKYQETQPNRTVCEIDTLFWHNSAETPRDQTLTDGVSTSEKPCDDTVIHGKLAKGTVTEETKHKNEQPLTK